MTCIDLAQLDEVTGGISLGNIETQPYPYGPDPLFPRRHPGNPATPLQPGKPAPVPNAPIHVGPLPPDFRNANIKPL